MSHLRVIIADNKFSGEKGRASNPSRWNNQREAPTFFPDYFQKAHRLGLGTTCMKNDSPNYHTQRHRALIVPYKGLCGMGGGGLIFLDVGG